MNSTLKKLLLVSLSVLEVLGARTVEELKVAYEVRMLAVGKEHQESLEKLASGYSGALNEVQKKLQDGGRLDDVLKVVEEKKKLKEQKWPLGRLDPSAPADLLRLRKIYEDSRIEADRTHAKAVIETSDRMEQLLEQLTKSLTQAGNISEARKAKDLRESIQTNPDVKAARELILRVKLNQGAPIAYRLRRSGDDLEVLVRFDKSGKVSLDSPVENTVELTGGRREKGETKAKVLGEFVGAKGYKVDPFVAYESDMDKIVPPLRASEYRLQARTEVEGRRALQVTLPDHGDNSRVEWTGVLPPVASASYLQIDFHYFIPSSNKNLKGFELHWGFGAPIEKKLHETKGRWVSESLETESLNEQSTLRMYGKGYPVLNGKAMGGNEAIYLDDFKITILSFAAHLVAKYEDGKVIGPENDDPETQKAIVLAGKLLPSSTD